MTLLAHTGGFSWDEALFIVLPVVVLFVLSRQARKKAQAAERAAADDAPESSERPPTGG